MPGVFRRRWFPRRSAKASSALNQATNLIGVEVTTGFSNLSISESVSSTSLSLAVTAQIGTMTQSSSFALTGVSATVGIGAPEQLPQVNLIGLQVVAQSNIEFQNATIHPIGVSAVAYPISEDIILPAGGGGGGAAGLFGDGEDGQDGQIDGTGGYGGSADGSTVPRQTTPGADGIAGTEFDGIIGNGSGGAGGSYGVTGQDGGTGGLYGGGGGGGGGGSSQTGLGGQGADGVVYIEYVGDLGLTKIIYHAGDTGPFVVPADWSGTNKILLVGPGGCGSAGTVLGGGNGGFGGDTVGVENTLIFNPGDVIDFTIPTEPCTEQPTVFGSYQAASGTNAAIVGGGGGSGGPASVGFPGGFIAAGGNGGPGGRLKSLGLAGQVMLTGVSATAMSETSILIAGIPQPRTFFIAGINQTPVAPGVVMFPTSEDVNLDNDPYVIGSSQFYTIGQVLWDGDAREQGVDWEFVSPFTHIIQLLVDTSTISTPITLLYYRWDIRVRSGFRVTDYPIPFGFASTSIIAERVPPINEFFTVSYTSSRPGVNPVTMYSRHPHIVDDILSIHTLYDGDSGFESYRPVGYRVFDLSDNTLYTWDGNVWASSGIFQPDTLFYVKRLRGIYGFDGVTASLFYLSGDTLDPTYPEAIAYPLFGESIGVNLLRDAFTANAAIDFPSAYEISMKPGFYDDWLEI